MKSNIVLIGMMGTFKSTCGKLLADKIDQLFLDIDALIEYEESMTIAEIFAKYGEEYFRDIESKKMQIISGYENIIISTGGGVVLRDINMQGLKKSSYIVLLTATSEIIFSRVKKTKNRPLLKKMRLETIKKLNDERKELYSQYADIMIDTSNLAPLAVVEEIQSKLYDFVLKDIEKGRTINEHTVL